MPTSEPNEKRDDVVPGTHWEFNEEVTDAFDDMLRRSIPQYEVMRQSSFDVGCAFRTPSTDIVDLGCARGDAIVPFLDRYGATNRFQLLERSQPMLEAAKERFAGWISSGVVRVRDWDLREGLPPCSASLVLSILTLQFTPIEKRPKILGSVAHSLIGGGALVLVEKCIDASPVVDDLWRTLYHEHKHLRGGYSYEQIDRKAASLEGVLVPITMRANEQLLRGAGFQHVTTFWQWMSFVGWVAVR